MDVVGRLQANPADRGLRQVVIDRWLEQGDPRAGWGAALRRDDPDVAERALHQLVSSLPGPEPDGVRAIEGFVVEVAWRLGAFVDPPPSSAPLAAHPLAVVRLRLPRIVDSRPIASQLTPDTFSRALTNLAIACGPVRGVMVEGLRAEHWPLVQGWIADLAPRVLGLELSDAAGIDLPLDPWPSVRDVLLGGVRSLDLPGWLEAVPSADRIALRASRGLVEGWLAVDRPWRAADLRGLVFDPAALPELQERAARTWIRLPGFFESRGLDHVDDPFGERGTCRPSRPTRSTRLAAVSPGSPLRWVQCDGRRLRWHLDDAPQGELDAPARVTALLGRDRGVVWGDDTGALYEYVFGTNAPRRLAIAPHPIEELRAGNDGDTVFVRTAEALGVLTLPGAHLELGLLRVDAVAPTPFGTVTARHSVLRTPRGSLDLGDPITGIAASGDAVTVVAGTWWYRVDLDGPSARLRLDERLRPSAGTHRIVARGPWLAWIEGSSRVRLQRTSEDGQIALHELTYPSSYQGPDGPPLEVADLALHDDGTLLVVLTGGGANLCTWPDVLKLDEFPNQPHRRWVFVADGNILLAS